jgi:hypothetical protein
MYMEPSSSKIFQFKIATGLYSSVLSLIVAYDNDDLNDPLLYTNFIFYFE